jgi:hypothetical protein
MLASSDLESLDIDDFLDHIWDNWIDNGASSLTIENYYANPLPDDSYCNFNPEADLNNEQIEQIRQSIWS